VRPAYYFIRLDIKGDPESYVAGATPLNRDAASYPETATDIGLPNARGELLLGNRALCGHPVAWVWLTVDYTVEYLPQYGNHPGSAGFGVA